MTQGKWLIQTQITTTEQSINCHWKGSFNLECLYVSCISTKVKHKDFFVRGRVKKFQTVFKTLSLYDFKTVSSFPNSVHKNPDI